MDRHQYEKEGFGKVGNRGIYGGIVTVINELPVSTKFWVENGHWDGEIIEINGVKHMDIAGGRKVNLELGEEYVLEITIRKEDTY